MSDTNNGAANGQAGCGDAPAEFEKAANAAELRGGMGANNAHQALEGIPSPSSSFSPGPSGAHSTVKGKSGIRRARGLVALAVVAFVLVGLAFHWGVGTPSALGVGQLAAICPLGALEAMFGAKEFMLHPLILLVVVVVAIVVVGKAFCAWMCPVPWLRKFFSPSKRRAAAGDALSGQGRGDRSNALRETEPKADSEERTGNAARDGERSDEESDIARQARELAAAACKGPSGHAAGHACGGCASACALPAVGGKRDGVQIDSRHAVLAGTLASAAVFGFPVFCLVCPVGLTFATLIGVWNLFRFNEPSWALIVFPAILVFEVVFLKKWCGKICPISALVSLVSNVNVTLKPKVDKTRCLRQKGIDCHACVDVCPEQLDPHTRCIPECSKCGKCVDACPARAISIALLAKKD